jgi:arginine deiminase
VSLSGRGFWAVDADNSVLINQFARDPQVVIGIHVIETNLRIVFRNKEHLGYDQLWPARPAEDPDARQVRIPEATAVLRGEKEDDFLRDPRPFLEGGDTFVIGKDVLIGFSSLRRARPTPRGCSSTCARTGASGAVAH